MAYGADCGCGSGAFMLFLILILLMFGMCGFCMCDVASAESAEK